MVFWIGEQGLNRDADFQGLKTLDHVLRKENGRLGLFNQVLVKGHRSLHVGLLRHKTSDTHLKQVVFHQGANQWGRGLRGQYLPQSTSSGNEKQQFIAAFGRKVAMKSLIAAIDSLVLSKF